MSTDKQQLGDFGEQLVAKHVKCPGCKRGERTFRVLPRNFKCADVICDFCGYLAQVKSKRISGDLPQSVTGKILGAAWAPQHDRMEAGIYFSLYVVLVTKTGGAGIYFLPRDLQTEEMFVPRKPLSKDAKRAGWQGFVIDMDLAAGRTVRVSDGDVVEFRFNV